MPTEIQVWDWFEAFQKYGFGENETHNDEVVEVLEGLGYKADQIRCIHNDRYIGAILKDGQVVVELDGDEDEGAIRNKLPKDLVAALDKEFPSSSLEQEDNDEKGYAEAEAVLDDWDYHSLPDGEKIIWAIDKAKQAIRDCLKMRLSGIGDDSFFSGRGPVDERNS